MNDESAEFYSEVSIEHRMNDTPSQVPVEESNVSRTIAKPFRDQGSLNNESPASSPPLEANTSMAVDGPRNSSEIFPSQGDSIDNEEGPGMTACNVQTRYSPPKRTSEGFSVERSNAHTIEPELPSSDGHQPNFSDLENETSLDVDHRASDLEVQLRQAKRDLTSSRSQHTKDKNKLTATLQKANEINDLLKKQLEKEKKKVEKKREQYWKRIKLGPIAAGDDEQMYRRLLKLIAKCDNWSEKHSVSDDDFHKLTLIEKSSVMNVLKLRFDAISSKGEALILSKGVKVISKLLLNTILTHLVWHHILAKPWHFLKCAGVVDGPEDTERAIAWLFDLGISAGDVVQKNTCLWLGMMLKALHPTLIGEEEKDPEQNLRVKCDKMREAFFNEVAADLERNCELLLKKTTKADLKTRRDRLWTIFRSAQDAAHQLWTQGYKIRSQGRKDLPNTFKHNYQSLSAHRTMRIDDSDHSRNGEEIFLVTNPGLQACGDDDGNFSSSRWRNFNRAQVCMASKEELVRGNLHWMKEQESQGYAIVSTSPVTDSHEVVPCKSHCAATMKTPAPSGFPQQCSSSMIPETAKQDGTLRKPVLPVPTNLPNATMNEIIISSDEQNQPFKEKPLQFSAKENSRYEIYKIDPNTGSRKRMLSFIDSDEPSTQTTTAPRGLEGNFEIAIFSRNESSSTKKQRLVQMDELMQNPENISITNEAGEKFVAQVSHSENSMTALVPEVQENVEFDSK